MSGGLTKNEATQTGFVLFVPATVAGPAGSPATPLDDQIFAAVRVPIRAHLLSQLTQARCLAALPSPDILLLRDCLKMSRVDALAVAAKMVDHHPRRDRASNRFKDEAVRTAKVTAPHGREDIAIRRRRFPCKPAAVWRCRETHSQTKERMRKNTAVRPGVGLHERSAITESGKLGRARVPDLAHCLASGSEGVDDASGIEDGPLASDAAACNSEPPASSAHRKPCADPSAAGLDPDRPQAGVPA